VRDAQPLDVAWRGVWRCVVAWHGARRAAARRVVLRRGAVRGGAVYVVVRSVAWRGVECSGMVRCVVCGHLMWGGVVWGDVSPALGNGSGNTRWTEVSLGNQPTV